MILYIINSHILDEFKTMASPHLDDLAQFVPIQFQDINIYVTVCNIWLTLRSQKYKHFLDENKRMNYASAFLQLELIEKQQNVKQFVVFHRYKNEPLFFLSFFISIQVMSWLTLIMERTNQLAIVEHYKQEENFTTFDANENSHLFKLELDYQKKYVQVMMHNIKNTTQFDVALKTAITQTRTFISNGAN